MCDHDRGSTCQRRLQRELHGDLGFGVQVGRRLVEVDIEPRHARCKVAKHVQVRGAQVDDLARITDTYAHELLRQNGRARELLVVLLQVHAARIRAAMAA